LIHHARLIYPAHLRARLSARLLAFTETKNRSAASRLEYAVKRLTRLQKVTMAKKWKSTRARKYVPGNSNCIKK
jgi:predicted GIY-YIG superfamily endonuclease